MDYSNFSSFDEQGLKIKNLSVLDQNPNIRELLSVAEQLYQSDPAFQDQAKRQSQCPELWDKGENLSPLGSILLALESLR
jgi:hypothetical protein